MENSNDKFIQWYIDMIENFPNTFVHYLSNNAIFHWFGRSIKGSDRILYFIKTNMQGSKHIIGDNSESSSRTTNSASAPVMRVNETPVSCTPDSSSIVDIDEFACGDGPNIDNLPLRARFEEPEPESARPVSLFETTGAIEFCRPCSKRGVAETRWERPCTLRISYVGSLTSPMEFSIKSIAYGDNMHCKRNLLPDFNACFED